MRPLPPPCLARHGVRVLDLVPGRDYTPSCRVSPRAQGHPMAPTAPRGCRWQQQREPTAPQARAEQEGTDGCGLFMMPFHPPYERDRRPFEGHDRTLHDPDHACGPEGAVIRSPETWSDPRGWEPKVHGEPLRTCWACGCGLWSNSHPHGA